MENPDKIYLLIDKQWGGMVVNYDRNDPDNIEYLRKDALMVLLDAEKEETSIGLNEWENGVEHGRMEVIMSLTEKIKAL